MHFDLLEILRTVANFGALGYIVVFLATFAESGLFFGFFLPGDSLLFTAGLLASQNVFHIVPLTIGLVIAAILGDNVGYWTGRKLGMWLMRQPDSLLFKKKYLIQAQRFYEKHGGKTLILARFMPAIRTFAPIAAGIADMEYSRFFLNNVIGGVLWASGMSLGGYFLGSIIPDVDKYLLPILAVIIVVSVVPALWHMMKKEEPAAANPNQE
jgi:membrane-associated protein